MFPNGTADGVVGSPDKVARCCDSKCLRPRNEGQEQEQSPSAAAVASSAKQHATTTTTTTTVANAQVFDSSWSSTAIFTVTGKPLGNARTCKATRRASSPSRKLHQSSLLPLPLPPLQPPKLTARHQRPTHPCRSSSSHISSNGTCLSGNHSRRGDCAECRSWIPILTYRSCKRRRRVLRRR